MGLRVVHDEATSRLEAGDITLWRFEGRQGVRSWQGASPGAAAAAPGDLRARPAELRRFCRVEAALPSHALWRLGLRPDLHSRCRPWSSLRARARVRPSARTPGG